MPPTLKSNINKFYIFQVFISAEALFVPIAVLFWQDNHLSLTQIMILQSLFSVMVVLLEVPTGYFADVFGRKKTLTLATICMVLGFLAYALGSNFYQFLIAELILAFAISFASGADSALIFDTLKNLKRGDEYKKIWGNAFFYSYLALAFFSFFGGIIGKYNFRWTLYATTLLTLPAILITLTLKEPKCYKPIFKRGYILDLFITLKKYVLKNKKIQWLIIYSGIVLGFNGAAIWLYQPYFSLSGVDILYFGAIFAAFQLVSGISSKYAHRLEKKLGIFNSLLMLAVLTSVSYLLMSHFIFLFSFSFAFLQQIVRGFSSVVISDYINQIVPSSVRATILSVQSMSSKLIYATIIPFIGWIADVYSLTQAFFILGITVAVTGAVILIFFKISRSAFAAEQ